MVTKIADSSTVDQPPSCSCTSVTCQRNVGSTCLLLVLSLIVRNVEISELVHTAGTGLPSSISTSVKMRTFYGLANHETLLHVCAGIVSVAQLVLIWHELLLCFALSGQGGQHGAHLRSLLDAMTRSQSLTLCFFKNFFVRYLRYLYKHEST